MTTPINTASTIPTTAPVPRPVDVPWSEASAELVGVFTGVADEAEAMVLCVMVRTPWDEVEEVEVVEVEEEVDTALLDDCTRVDWGISHHLTRLQMDVRGADLLKR